MSELLVFIHCYKHYCLHLIMSIMVVGVVSMETCEKLQVTLETLILKSISVEFSLGLDFCLFIQMFLSVFSIFYYIILALVRPPTEALHRLGVGKRVGHVPVLRQALCSTHKCLFGPTFLTFYLKGNNFMFHALLIFYPIICEHCSIKSPINTFITIFPIT